MVRGETRRFNKSNYKIINKPTAINPAHILHPKSALLGFPLLYINLCKIISSSLFYIEPKANAVRGVINAVIPFMELLYGGNYGKPQSEASFAS